MRGCGQPERSASASQRVALLARAARRWRGVAVLTTVLSLMPVTHANAEILFLVEFKPGAIAARSTGAEQAPGKRHAAFLQSLFEQGNVLLGGEVGPGRMILVMRAGSQREAEALVNADPAVVAGALAVEVRRWNVDMSSVRLIKQRARRVDRNADGAFVIEARDTPSPIRLGPGEGALPHENSYQ